MQLFLCCGERIGSCGQASCVICRAARSCVARSHAARAYGAGTGPQTDAAQALLAKITAGKVQDGFKPADVYLKGWTHLNKPEAVKSAAAMLCDLGHLRRVETRPQGAGRPSITYRINPATLPEGRA